ncbi:MAG: sigma-70 family RNA polymerase sigma factor [Planctomycetes bacterium]|nr:sigma-70 family RNA polymerase sigma factor [Planctomycetota bacterium]
MATVSETATAAGNGPADLLLVQAALRAERDAVDALVVRLGCVPRFVFRLNRVLGLGLPSEALEDVVQQVYAALWARLGGFHGRNPLETWVFGFCRNCLRAASRRGRDPRRATMVAPEVLAALPAGEPDAPQELGQNEALAALRDELAELPDAERAAVEARHLDGASFEDLARASGVAVSTIKDRCYRAMQRLQQRLGRRLLGA